MKLTIYNTILFVSIIVYKVKGGKTQDQIQCSNSEEERYCTKVSKVGIYSIILYTAWAKLLFLTLKKDWKNQLFQIKITSVKIVKL